MLCRDFRQNLSLYIDDALSSPIRIFCDEHLRECPLCREELLTMQSLADDLQNLKRNTKIPAELALSLRHAVAIELAAQQQINQPKPQIPFWREVWGKYLEPRLVPYSVGAVASVLLFVMMFASLRSSIMAFSEIEAEARRERLERERLLAFVDNTPYEQRTTLPAADYAVRRLLVSSESPSLNPNSAFVALTSTLTRSGTKNEAIMVVADVFKSGMAEIANVIEPPREPNKLAELEKLLRDEPAFVPAALDHRPDNVRVVFLIQQVDVPILERAKIHENQKNAKLRLKETRFNK